MTDSVERVLGKTVTDLFTGDPLASKYWMLTVQIWTGSGFCRVSHSVKPWPTLPSAKYHVGLTGPGGKAEVVVAVGESVGVGDGTTVFVGVGDEPLVGVGVGTLF